jgi:hypothetical protein
MRRRENLTGLVSRFFLAGCLSWMAVSDFAGSIRGNGLSWFERTLFYAARVLIASKMGSQSESLG